MITTTLTSTEKGDITHKGTSGFTITGIRDGSQMETLIEYSVIENNEMREMVCVLLCMLEEQAGETFIASCLGRYAEETGKKFMSEGNGRKLVMIRS